MRIVCFIENMKGGGAQRSTLSIAKHLKACGHNVRIALVEARGEFLADVPSDIPVIDIGGRHFVQSAIKFSLYLSGSRPHVVIANLPRCNLIAGISTIFIWPKPRLILTERSILTGDFNAWSRKRQRIFGWLIPRIYRRAYRVVSVSQGVGHDLVQNFGIPRDLVQTIYNPVVSEILFEKAAETANFLGSIQDIPFIVAVGRLQKEKDFLTLIRAFALVHVHRACGLIILGEGQQRAALEGEVKRLGVVESVAMPGFVSNPYAIVKQASVNVLSSRQEGLGNALIEAMALGVPVVATDCPAGPREILEDGRWGALVPVGAPDEMARAILNILDGGGIDPRPRAQAFTAERSYAAYRDLVGERSETPC